jgi:3-methyladenine DNA glycosylase AlkD
MKTSKQIITHLKSLENSKNQEGMKRFAIGNELYLEILKN